MRKRLVGKQRDPAKAMKMRKNGARAGRDWAMVATPPAKRRRWSVGTPAKVVCDGTREPLEPSSDRDAEFGPSGCHCDCKQRQIAVYRVETERRDRRAPCTVFQAEFLQGEFLTGAEQCQLVQVSALFGRILPDALAARRSVALLSKLVFSRRVRDVMVLTGMTDNVMYAIAGQALHTIKRLNIDAVLRCPAPEIFRSPLATAFAILQIAAPMVLDQDAERALRGVVRANAAVTMGEITNMCNVILQWLVRRCD